MNFVITINGSTICKGQIVDTVNESEFAAALIRVTDRYLAIRECRIDLANRPSRDMLWIAFLDSLAAEHGTTSAALMGKKRGRPLPIVRALAAAAWHDQTEETWQHISRRLGMDHSSVLYMRDQLDEKGKRDKVLRQQHFDAIEICKAIFNTADQ